MSGLLDFLREIGIALSLALITLIKANQGLTPLTVCVKILFSTIAVDKFVDNP